MKQRVIVLMSLTVLTIFLYAGYLTCAYNDADSIYISIFSKSSKVATFLIVLVCTYSHYQNKRNK